MGWALANAEMATGLAPAASGQMPQTLTLWPLPCPGAHKASPAALHPHTTGQLLTPLEHQQEQRGSPAAEHAARRSLEETHRERVGLGPGDQGALNILWSPSLLWKTCLSFLDLLLRNKSLRSPWLPPRIPVP